MFPGAKGGHAQGTMRTANKDQNVSTSLAGVLQNMENEKPKAPKRSEVPVYVEGEDDVEWVPAHLLRFQVEWLMELSAECASREETENAKRKELAKELVSTYHMLRARDSGSAPLT